MTTEINKHEITRGDNLDMTISPYNPEEIPEGYFYGKRSLRDRFGRNVSKYVHRCHNEQGPVDIVELLCPDYPHNGSQFTYEGEMGSGLNPSVISDFLPRSEMLLYGMSLLGADIKTVVFRPLVCEIESDLSCVVDQFAEGSADLFEQNVRLSAGCAQEAYGQRFPYSTVEAGVFKTLMVDLPRIQVEVAEKMAQLFESGSLPNTFAKQLEFVASNRNHMFSKLYGAREHSEFFNLAFRQMCNYLAVYKSLALRFPKGCIILNKHTPNEVYVRQNKKMLRELLDIPDFVRILPIFNFF